MLTGNMFRRLIYRLLIIVPVTLSILLITLFLFYQLPGSQVLDSSRIELGSDRELEQLIWLQEKQQPLRHARGLFYIGIHEGSFPDSLNLIPPVFRSSVKELSKQVKNRKVMNAWIVWVHGEMEALKHGRKTLMTSRELFQLLKATTLNELNDEIKSMDRYPGELARLLESNPANDQSMLHVSWNGSQNLFHSYLRAIWSGEPALKTLSGERVRVKFLRSLRWTLAYTLPVLLLGWGIVYFLVLWFYDRRSVLTWMDRGSVFFYSFPTFVLATLALVFLTSHRYGLLSGIFPFPLFIESGVDSLLDIYRQFGTQLILPMLLFAISPMILFYRVFYEKIKEVKKTRPSYRYLRHVGISANKFRFRYLSRYLFVATFAVVSNLFVAVLGGSLVIEWIFNIPGLGRFLYESIMNYDTASTVYLILIFAIVQQLGHVFSDFMIYYFFTPDSISSGTL